MDFVHLSKLTKIVVTRIRTHDLGLDCSSWFLTVSSMQAYLKDQAGACDINFYEF